MKREREDELRAGSSDLLIYINNILLYIYTREKGVSLYMCMCKLLKIRYLKIVYHLLY